MACACRRHFCDCRLPCVTGVRAELRHGQRRQLQLQDALRRRQFEVQRGTYGGAVPSCACDPFPGAHAEKSGCRGSGPGSESRALLVPQLVLQHLRVRQASAGVSVAIDLVATVTYNHGSQSQDETVYPFRTAFTSPGRVGSTRQVGPAASFTGALDDRSHLQSDRLWPVCITASELSRLPNPPPPALLPCREAVSCGHSMAMICCSGRRYFL